MQMLYVTCPNIDKAREIAASLVENRIVTCVNIIPQMSSIYVWEGKIVEDSECILILKASAEVPFQEIENSVRALHPYRTPAIVQLQVNTANQDYVDWIRANSGTPN